jgi:hypothetical protein
MKNHDVIVSEKIDDITKSGVCWHCGKYVESWFFDDDNTWTKFGTIRSVSNVKNLNKYCPAPRKEKPDFSLFKSWREVSRLPEAIALRKELMDKYDKAYKERFRIDE